LPTLSSLRHLVRFERACLPGAAPNPVATAFTCPELQQACPKIARLPGRSCPAAARSVALAYPTYRSHQDLQRPGPAVPAYTAPVDASPGMCHVCMHSHRAFCRLAAGTADPLCPARPRPQGNVVQTREMLNLTKSPSCPCLPCTFPPARRFRPLGLWQPSLGGTPQ
jgi:hypothetical protein